jgi:Domain of unknown function (DUF4395)
MGHTRNQLFSFPNPVNEYAARTVAGGVVVMAVVALAADQPWLLIPLVYGFWARVLTGPTLSPLGQLATRVIAPALSSQPKLTPGPPKRFAQAIGATFSTVALVLWLSGQWTGAEVFIGLLAAAALLESAFAICLGCKAFALLMRVGVIPESVCVECADISGHLDQVASERH